MNDEDKETFDKWLSDASNHYADALAYEFERHLCFVSWQAACEYKQDEIDKLNKINDHLVNQLMYALEFKEVEQL